MLRDHTLNSLQNSVLLLTSALRKLLHTPSDARGEVVPPWRRVEADVVRILSPDQALMSTETQKSTEKTKLEFLGKADQDRRHQPMGGLRIGPPHPQPRERTSRAGRAGIVLLPRCSVSYNKATRPSEEAYLSSVIVHTTSALPFSPLQTSHQEEGIKFLLSHKEDPHLRLGQPQGWAFCCSISTCWGP